MSKLKRLKAPKFWKLPKKSRKWAVSPRPGPHRKFESIPLAIALRDIVKIAETGSEAKKIIKMGEILVDGKIRRDHKYPAGLMDAISIPKMKIFPCRFWFKGFGAC
jgi:small subunit ribosomal protein S4e